MGTQRNLTGRYTLEIPVTDYPEAGDALEYISHLFPSLYINRYNTTITVNGEISPADRLLKSGDKIVFLPIIGGG